KAIRAGKVCYYLPDQDPGPKRAVFAPFFGIPTATWPVLGKLAELSRAAVLPCATYLTENGKRFEIVLGEPLDPFPTGTELGDAEKMNSVIERSVREMPDQYFWVHKRFKTRPPGSQSLYL
ncbi:MAG: lysophospholipid acyltransferase family protein, partial [Gammaproteobacteria bacterium]